MRTFVALDIDQELREDIAQFQNEVRSFAPDARWMLPRALHMTLKFIGESSMEQISELKRGLSSVVLRPVQIVFRGWGFFPGPKDARVFWLGIQPGADLLMLAKVIDKIAKQLGAPRVGAPGEKDAFTPHLTIARAGRKSSGAPGPGRNDTHNTVFQKLQERLLRFPPPAFGSSTVEEFHLYESKLGRDGSSYTKLASFRLRDSGVAS